MRTLQILAALLALVPGAAFAHPPDEPHPALPPAASAALPAPMPQATSETTVLDVLNASGRALSFRVEESRRELLFTSPTKQRAANLADGARLQLPLKVGTYRVQLEGRAMKNSVELAAGAATRLEWTPTAGEEAAWSLRVSRDGELLFEESLQPASAPTPPGASPGVGRQEGQFTCPMHPEVRLAQPGECPKCGMALVRQAPPSAPSKPETQPGTQSGGGCCGDGDLMPPSSLYACPEHSSVWYGQPGACPQCGSRMVEVSR
ncbi:MAG: hypothetical protein HYZ53_19530 [Planctomycetes bacterium]|nr:hypothetical protein [Planctomycetota bacterium]